MSNRLSYIHLATLPPRCQQDTPVITALFAGAYGFLVHCVSKLSKRRLHLPTVINVKSDHHLDCHAAILPYATATVLQASTYELLVH